MSVKTYGRTALIGGASGALDEFDADNLNEGDRCLTILSTGEYYFHRLNASSGAAESSPDVVKPNSGGGTSPYTGDKRWILAEATAPQAHKTSHQNGGADEINVGGLSGLLADDQHVLDTEVKAAAVSDDVYAAGWNTVTDVAPSKNAVYDKIEAMGGGLANVVEDITPQLGGNLDMNGMSIGGNTEAQLDDAVAKKHTQGTDTSLGTQTANINMGTHKLTALSVPSANGQSVRTTTKITEVSLEDAVDKKHTQGSDTALGAQAENLDMNTHKIVGVVDPTTDQEVATKKYVDDNAGGAHALVAKTANYNVQATDLAGLKTFTNDGAGGEITFTLPAGVVNYRVGFIVTDAQYLKVTANGTEKFRYGATQGAAGGYIRCNVVGSAWIITWTADDWLISPLSGILKYDE